MRNTLFAFAILPILFVSCQQKQTKTEVSKPTETVERKVENTFVVDSIKVDDSIKINENLTDRYTTTLLVFDGIKNKPLLDSIYSEFNLKSSDYSKQGLLKVLEADKKSYFEESKKINSDLERDFAMTLDATRKMKVFSNKDDILTLQYEGSGYTGGAHGYYAKSYKNFDLKNNKVIQIKDIVYFPKIDWNKILMESFKKNVPKDQQDMLLEKQIPVNNNFYFDDKNIYFVYNQYEIAAYAAGVITIPISWESLNGNYDKEFRKRLENK